MVKAKKLLALISSVVMIASIGAMSVSAGIAGEKYYDSTYTNENGYIEPIRVYENLIYTGIVVTMPDANAPTVEEIGIDCKISEYNAVNYEKLQYTSVNDGAMGWGFEESIASEANQYMLDTDEVMSEDEAIEFSKKLLIRGIVEKADVLYAHLVSNGNIAILSDNKVVVTVDLKNDSSEVDFSIENYPEIKEILKYSEYEIEVKDSTILIYCDLEDSDYIDLKTNVFDSMNAYNDIVALKNILISTYDEIKNVDIWFGYLYSDNATDAVYSIQSKWGDATNDDKVDLYDAIEIAKYIMDISEFDEDTKLLADINRDGVTDLYDAIEIARIIMEESKVG